MTEKTTTVRETTTEQPVEPRETVEKDYQTGIPHGHREANRVKNRRRGYTRVSTKHQVTIPVATLRDAGIRSQRATRCAPRSAGRARSC